MTVGAILSRTTNYLFRKLNFDYPYWHSYEHLNWDELDAALYAVATAKGIKGPWINNLVVAVGDKYVDTSNGVTYVALVAHTTPSSGTFATDRTANPSRWIADAAPDSSITLAKLPDMATDSFLGRDTAGVGDPEVLSAQQARSILALNTHGQCRIEYVNTSTLRLDPHKGNKLVIGDVPCTIPDAGVTVDVAGTTANNNYYLFAVDANNDGIVDGLEAALTSVGIGTHIPTGVLIKSGDSTRTLVGLARTVTGPAWTNTASKRFVRSYFNRSGVELNNSFTAARTTASTTAVEINTEIRVEFVLFDDDIVTLTAACPVLNSAGGNTAIAPSFDGVAPISYSLHGAPAAEATDISRTRTTSLATGYHYATVFGYVGGGTATYGLGGTLGNLNGSIR